MLELSKKTKKRLRELLKIAYAKELDQHLLDLSKKFDDWKDKKIDCFELSEKIHKFHDGISRDLFDAYNHKSVSDVYMIARALVKNLIKQEDIPDEVIDAVQACTTFFERE